MLSRAALSCVLLVLGGGCGGAPAVSQTPIDALDVHARAQDDEGLRRARAALAGASRDERMHALAALLEYDSVKLQPMFEAIKARATRGADAGERAAAVWVLVHAGDVNAATSALPLYDAGELQRVKRLDGSPAFDAVALGRLVASTTLPPEAAPLRQKIILAALPAADAKGRALLVRALIEDAEDGVTLVSVAAALDPSKDFSVLEHLFERLGAIADPSAADALVHYADHATQPHFRTLAAMRLAEIADLRAAPHLAWRLGEDPIKLYEGDPNTVALARTDQERIISARLLGELTLMHPEAKTQLRETVEAPLLAWIRSTPQPHANALRLLVAIDSPQGKALLLKLADPQTPVPAVGAPPPVPDEFVVAQTALRYLGRSRDATARPLLDKQLQRKPAAFDASMDALTQGNGAITAMVYRSLMLGAVEGLWELGDSKSLPLLVHTADDPKANEMVRIEACAAAAWLADAQARRDLVARIRVMPAGRKHELDRICWITGLGRRPNAAADAPLVSLVAPKVEAEVRHDVARLLGHGGLAAPERTKVEALLTDRALVHDAALMLLFGGNEASVSKALGAYEVTDADDAPASPAIESLKQLYVRSVADLDEDLATSGALARMARLAVAARDVTVRGTKQTWLLQALAYQLRQAGQFDAGPHTMTRVRLRAQLLADARGSDAQKRDDALLVLWVLGERASLASLGDVAKARLAEPSP